MNFPGLGDVFDHGFDPADGVTGSLDFVSLQVSELLQGQVKVALTDGNRVEE